MTLITVVEPDGLLRLGILKLLEGLPEGMTLEELDDTQLVADSDQQPPDLVLLSVPDDYQKTVDLIAATRQHLAANRFLLLSDTTALSYSLLRLPHGVSGYISKRSDRSTLLKAITLVLAGGTCFPHPDAVQVPPADHPCDPPRQTPCKQYPLYQVVAEPATHPEEPAKPMGLLVPLASAASLATERTTIRMTPPRTATPPDPPPQRQCEPLPQKLIDLEARLLNLTHRQYQVLALLARGLPLKGISRELKISASTAKTHTEALFSRLSVNNRNAAVYTAIARGATLGWDHLPYRGLIEDSSVPPPSYLEARLLNLTHRQYQVLALLSRGLRLKDISCELKISASTAKTHIDALYSRLSVNNRNAAVYTAIARGATLGWDHLPGRGLIEGSGRSSADLNRDGANERAHHRTQ